MYLINELKNQAQNRKLIKQLDSGVCPGCGQNLIRKVQDRYECPSCKYIANLNYNTVSYLKKLNNNR